MVDERPATAAMANFMVLVLLGLKFKKKVDVDGKMLYISKSLQLLYFKRLQVSYFKRL